MTANMRSIGLPARIHSKVAFTISQKQTFTSGSLRAKRFEEDECDVSNRDVKGFSNCVCFRLKRVSNEEKPLTAKQEVTTSGTKMPVGSKKVTHCLKQENLLQIVLGSAKWHQVLKRRKARSTRPAM